MPGIKIYGDASPLQGELRFLDKAIGSYLAKHRNSLSEQYQALKTAVQGNNTYLTDLTLQNLEKGIDRNQMELVHFSQDKEPQYFQLRLHEDLSIDSFRKTTLAKMSPTSQEMVAEIQQEEKPSERPAIR